MNRYAINHSMSLVFEVIQLFSASCLAYHISIAGDWSTSWCTHRMKSIKKYSAGLNTTVVAHPADVYR